METEIQPDDCPHKWQYNRTLTPERFARIVRNLGMTMAGAGRYLGVSERTVYRYATGDALVPVSTVLLLRVLLEYGIQPVVPSRKGSASYREGVVQKHPPTPSG